jgi:hypothetical protein
LPVAARPKAKLFIDCYSGRNRFNYISGSSVNKKLIGGSSVISKVFGGNPVICRLFYHGGRDQDTDSWVLRIRARRVIAIGINYGRFYGLYGHRLNLRVSESFLYGYGMQLFLLCFLLRAVR